MKLPKFLERVKTQIIERSKPVSIFLYGSFNTDEYLSGTSDLEIGVLRNKKIDVPNETLRDIAALYSNRQTRLRIYPYDIKGLKNGSFNSPFTKSVFVRHLILTSKTIWGEKIIENLPLPSVTLIDAYREACFTTMRSLSALFFLRAGDLEEAKEMSYKACLFATLSLEYLNGDFPIGFKDIVKASEKLKLSSSERKLIQQAYKLRQGKLKINKEAMYNLVFSVITYCNQTVEARIKEKLNNKVNKVIVK